MLRITSVIVFLALFGAVCFYAMPEMATVNRAAALNRG